MNLDENALLKNMISGIDVNDGNKVPSSAYIHSLVERIGMGTALEGGFDNLTAGLNSVNNNLSNISNRLTALTDIILTPANSYSFNADYTYGYKRAGWVEIQFSLVSAFDLTKDRILSIPNGCLPKKQVWFPVYESSGGNVIARGNIVGSNIYINGSNSINGKTKLFGHVVYVSES